MIRIGKMGVTSFGSARDLDRLRTQFNKHHYVRLRALLDPELLQFIQPHIDRGEFYERVHQDIGSNRELCMTGNTAFGALLLLMNDEKLFTIIQDVTQCDRIGCFEGRIYRVNPEAGHHDSWHNDLGEHRLVAMSINLSNEAYLGGVLQIRDRESGEIVSEAPSVGAGDAVIFRLSDSLQHRITEVEGKSSKTAFAGWFRAEPTFPALLRARAEPIREAN